MNLAKLEQEEHFYMAFSFFDKGKKGEGRRAVLTPSLGHNAG